MSYVNRLSSQVYRIETAYCCDTVLRLCAGVALECGWDNDPIDVPRSLMLMVSELSEAMEGHRKSLKDDKLPHRQMFDVELADTVIRIFHLAGRMQIPLGDILIEKLLYNSQRDDHKPENREKEGGKRY